MATASSTWPALIAGRKAKASEVEAKFDWIQSNIYPHKGGNLTDTAYDIGTPSARWASVYTRSINATTTADGIALGKTTADASACLDLSAFQKAIYLPILTTAERNALTPQAGFVIFNSTAARMERYEGGQWLAMNNPIGLVAKASGTTSGTYALVDVAGTGRLISLAFLNASAGGAQPTATITIDGTAYSVPAGAAIASGSQNRVYAVSDATSASFSFDSATTSGYATRNAPLDIQFKATMKIEFNGVASTVTAYAMYELA